MNPLSPLGWILIILLVCTIVGINLSLFLGSKKKPNPDSWVSRLQHAGRTARDPFHRENEDLEELSKKVKDLGYHQGENKNGE